VAFVDYVQFLGTDTGLVFTGRQIEVRTGEFQLATTARIDVSGTSTLATGAPSVGAGGGAFGGNGGGVTGSGAVGGVGYGDVVTVASMGSRGAAGNGGGS